jgi:PAS domain S-box-containing protein
MATRCVVAQGVVAGGKAANRLRTGATLKDSDCKVILDSIADGVFTVDRDWRISSWNQAAEVITGFSAGQALGRRCIEVFRTDRCHDACVLRRSIDTGDPQINVHVNICTHWGEQKPISVSTAVLRDAAGTVVGGVETFRDLSVIETLRKQLRKDYSFQDIISKNYRMQDLFNILPDVAQSDSTVLIQGPSGSGKELFASALHSLSPRSEKPLVVVNCAALPDTLLESELFGYKKGAFTDARHDKPGRFALANHGTLFLDEVGEIPMPVQVKLLRVLQDKIYEPLGATASVVADVRIIAATNRDLRQLTATGRFRDDLFFRLNVITLQIPPLHERKEDISLLVEHFIRRLNAQKGRAIEGITRDALACLMEHDFPGNVRELENIVEHAFVLCKSPFIAPRDLPKEILPPGLAPASSPSAPLWPEKPLRLAEGEAIRQALAVYGGHREKTARALSIHKTTLIRKMKKLKISYP